MDWLALAITTAILAPIAVLVGRAFWQLREVMQLSAIQQEAVNDMPRTYAPIPPPPKPGWYKSVYGGIEQTKLAGYPLGTESGLEATIPFNRDMSGDARRARIRERKRNEKTDLEAKLEATLAWLEAEECRNLKEFHNG